MHDPTEAIVDGEDNLGATPYTDPGFVDADNPAGEDGIWGTADDGLCLRVLGGCCCRRP